MPQPLATPPWRPVKLDVLDRTIAFVESASSLIDAAAHLAILVYSVVPPPPPNVVALSSLADFREWRAVDRLRWRRFMDLRSTLAALTVLVSCDIEDGRAKVLRSLVALRPVAKSDYSGLPVTAEEEKTA